MATTGGSLKPLMLSQSQTSLAIDTTADDNAVDPRRELRRSMSRKIQAVGQLSRDIARAHLKAEIERYAARLRVVPFHVFKQLGHIPRFGNSQSFIHPLSELANDNLCLPFEKFDRSKTVFIFVSHRWLMPRPGTEGHPDDNTRSKFELICEAINRLTGPSAPIPQHFKVALRSC